MFRHPFSEAKLSPFIGPPLFCFKVLALEKNPHVGFYILGHVTIKKEKKKRLVMIYIYCGRI
jgi:hypothetical protein